MGFQTAQPDMMPQWLQPDDEGTAFAASFGKTKDDELVLLKGAVKLPWPNVGPDDALPGQARDRSIRRAPPETNLEFRTKLQDPFGYHRLDGQKRGLADVFTPYGFDATTAHVYNNYQLVWDGNSVWWSRVFFLLDEGYWEVDGLWTDPGTYDDGGTWDSTATIADLDYLRYAIRERKWPGAYPVVIGAVLGSAPSGDGFWQSIGFYDDGGFWDDSAGDVVYFGLGHVFGEEAWYGGGPHLWDEPGDVWDDYFPPSGGWVFQ